MDGGPWTAPGSQHGAWGGQEGAGELPGTPRLGFMFSSAFILNLVVFVRLELFGKILLIRDI